MWHVRSDAAHVLHAMCPQGSSAVSLARSRHTPHVTSTVIRAARWGGRGGTTAAKASPHGSSGDALGASGGSGGGTYTGGRATGVGGGAVCPHGKSGLPLATPAAAGAATELLAPRTPPTATAEAEGP